MNKDFVIRNNILIKYTGTDKKIIIPNEVVAIDKKCFASNFDLEEVLLPNSLKIIKSGAFSNCVNLKKINLNEVNNISSFAFYSCISLKEADLKNIENLDKNSFLNCKLQKINLPIDKNYKMLDNYFENPKEIIINNSTHFAYNWIKRKDNITKITINNNEGEIYMPLLIGSQKAKEIEINNPNYKVKDGMIYSANEKKIIWCPPMLDIEKYKIPDTVKEIGEFAFVYNKTIKEIELGENIKKISKYAFGDCKIEKIKFNNKLEIIENNALCQIICKEIDLSKTNIKSLDLNEIGLQQSKIKPIKLIIPDKLEKLLYKNKSPNEFVITSNINRKKYNKQIQNVEDIIFQQTLEELIEEGKSFREASQIMKNYER